MRGNGETRREFVFYLLPEFTLLAFASAVEALRLANAVVGHDAYAWRLVSDDGSSAEASCGISLACDSTIEAERLAAGSRGRPFMVVVCGGRNVERYATRAGETWLRQCRQNAIAIASLCTGAHVLAQARLLDDRRCVIHWENYPSFTERFAGAAVRTGLFEIDGAIHTCAGGAASFDMMLHLIRSDFGEAVVSGVCEQAIVDRIRSSQDLQRMPFSPRSVRHHPVVARLIERMQETLADPVPVEALMADIGLTRRQIERLFRNELGQSPGKFYMKLRLERANLLLRQTRKPIVDVAVACGFSSASHFAKSYRDAYGRPPHEARARTPASRP
jgi:transcriptional regulator GlxA family with amidase domain